MTNPAPVEAGRLVLVDAALTAALACARPLVAEAGRAVRLAGEGIDLGERLAGLAAEDAAEARLVRQALDGAASQQE